MKKRTPSSSSVRLATALLLASPVLSLASCETVPETGRDRMMLFTSKEQENALGLDAYQQILSESTLVKSGSDYEMLQRVGRKIAAAAETRAETLNLEPYGFEWEFQLIDDPTVNAFCLPGGKVAVYTGILPVTQTEDGLAAVVGHEVAHATLRHGGERMGTNVLASGGLTAAALGLSLAGLEESTQTGVMAALNAGTQVAVVLPYSREHESEADEVGLGYLIVAGYDPYAAPKLWERMAALSTEQPPEFMSTHPRPGNRAEALRQLIPKLMKEAGRLKQIER